MAANQALIFGASWLVYALRSVFGSPVLVLWANFSFIHEHICDAMTETASSERQLNDLVFVMEKLSHPMPSEPLLARNFFIFYEIYGAHRRFQEFDAVAFQGIFEKFECHSNYETSCLSHQCDADELDKRKKEARYDLL